MPKLATVFSYEKEFPSEIQDYFDTCCTYVTTFAMEPFDFPLDWKTEDFEDSITLDAYNEVVVFLKARMLRGTEKAIIV